MKLLAIAAAAVTLSLGLGIGARAQTTARYVFTTVDAVSSYVTTLSITGIQEGQAAATEVRVYFYAYDEAAKAMVIQSCERKALLAMNKPGQYTFEVSWSTYGYPTCKLTRVNP